MSFSSSQVEVKRKKIINIGEKIQKLRSCRLDTQDRSIKNESIVIKQEPRVENKEEINDFRKKIMKIRQRVTTFNKTQTLFQDCFDVKKNAVQRSVSQLQSKLIGNREEFLNTCHAIGSKEEKVGFEVFNKLSSDEILTLFISFVWLNKKVTGEFSAKRRQIMDFMGKLPKINQDL